MGSQGRASRCAVFPRRCHPIVCRRGASRARRPRARARHAQYRHRGQQGDHGARGARGGHRRLRARGQDAPTTEGRRREGQAQLCRAAGSLRLPASAGCRVKEAKVEVEDERSRPRRQGQGSAEGGKDADKASPGIPNSTPSTRWSARPRPTSPRSSSATSARSPAPRSSTSTSSPPRGRANSRLPAPSPRLDLAGMI